MRRFLIIALLAFTVGIFAQCGDEGSQPTTKQVEKKEDTSNVPTKAELRELRSTYKALPKGSKERRKAYEKYRESKAAYIAAKS